MQLPDIKASRVLVIKLKKEWRKVRKRRGERRKTGDKKGKDGFQDGGMGEVDAQALLEIQGTEAS
jgi:hypothetical protein